MRHKRTEYQSTFMLKMIVCGDVWSIISHVTGFQTFILKTEQEHFWVKHTEQCEFITWGKIKTECVVCHWITPPATEINPQKVSLSSESVWQPRLWSNQSVCVNVCDLTWFLFSCFDWRLSGCLWRIWGHQSPVYLSYHISSILPFIFQEWWIPQHSSSD